jgi:hypothetical protein
LQALLFSFVQGIFSMGLAQQLFVGFVQWTAFGGKVGHQRWQLGHFADAHRFVGEGALAALLLYCYKISVLFRGQKIKGFRICPLDAVFELLKNVTLHVSTVDWQI